MSKKFVHSLSFYSVAIALGAYLAHGQPTAQYFEYISVTIFATVMTLRQSTHVLSEVVEDSGFNSTEESHPVIVLAHVEELLSQAS